MSRYQLGDRVIATQDIHNDPVEETGADSNLGEPIGCPADELGYETADEPA